MDRLEEMRRYVANMRQGYDIQAVQGRLLVFYHTVPVGEIFIGDGGQICVKSNHIKLKRRNAWGRNVMKTISLNKAYENVNTYIRMPTTREFAAWAVANLHHIVRQAAQQARRTAYEPIDDWVDERSKVELVEAVVLGIDDATRNKLMPLLEEHKYLSDLENDTGMGWFIAHDKISNIYHVADSKLANNHSVTVLPGIFIDKISVLRVCEQEEYTVQGAWRKASEFVDGYYIIGKDLHGIDPGKQS